MTTEEKQALPTIIEVLEELAQEEYRWHLEWTRQPNFLAPYFADDGEYMIVATKSHSLNNKLMPGSQSPFTLYRGQNRDFEKCVPSLFRIPEGFSKEEWNVVSRVRTAEFMFVLLQHPVVQDLQKRIIVDLVPVAQHYGFPTEYMDITNNKWVAAFFAVTQFCDDKYEPVNENYEDGIGVMYVAAPSKDVACQQFWMSEKIQALGFQYFARPTKQYSMVYQMNEGEDFNQYPAWRKILFRHDKEASDMVFKMSWKQERWFPNDVLSDKARMIRSNAYELAESSILLAKAKFDLPQSTDEIKDILSRHGMAWHSGNVIAAAFSPQEMSEDWQKWVDFGRRDLMTRIKQPMRLYDLPAPQINL